MNITDEYVNTHIRSMRFKLISLASKILKRAYSHDSSKLKEPEYTLWCKMDKEPRYKYGTKEYEDKVKRYKKVFDLHYKANSHHPEHYGELGIDGMDLIDLIEMTADWISYKKQITVEEAIQAVERQSKRYLLTDQLQSILKNTIINHFSTLTMYENYKEKQEIERAKKDLHVIDIKI